MRVRVLCECGVNAVWMRCECGVRRSREPNDDVAMIVSA